MTVNKSMEDYLEAIYMLTMDRGYARAIDVTNILGVTKPSVSVAMAKLEQNGYIRRNEDRFLYLEDKGLAIAKRVYERHETLAICLMALGASEKTAYEDACKIEHDLSDESFSCLQKHMAAHMGGSAALGSLHAHLDTNKKPAQN